MRAKINKGYAAKFEKQHTSPVLGGILHAYADHARLLKKLEGKSLKVHHSYWGLALDGIARPRYVLEYSRALKAEIKEIKDAFGLDVEGAAITIIPNSGRM